MDTDRGTPARSRLRTAVRRKSWKMRPGTPAALQAFPRPRIPLLSERNSTVDNACRLLSRQLPLDFHDSAHGFRSHYNEVKISEDNGDARRIVDDEIALLREHECVVPHRIVNRPSHAGASMTRKEYKARADCEAARDHVREQLRY